MPQTLVVHIVFGLCVCVCLCATSFMPPVTLEPCKPGSVARSDASPRGVQTVAGSILGSDKSFFRGD